MEALKKAEQAKQASQDAAASGEDPRLDPIDSSADAPAAASATQTATPHNLPNLPPQLEILDAEFIAHAEAGKSTTDKTVKRPTAPAAGTAFRQTSTQGRDPGVPSKARTAPGADTERQAAQQIFAAKQPERSRVGFFVAAGTFFVLGVTGISAYVWWQLQPKAGLAAPGLAMNMPRPSAATPAPAPTPPPPPLQPQTVVTAAAPVAAIAVATPHKAAEDKDEDMPAPPRPRAAARPAEAEGPIRITRSRLRVNPAAARAYEAMNAGDLETAKAEYLKLFAAEPKNGDALRGLAAVALRQGDTAAAGDWYFKALEADPKDAQAQAGLIGLRGHGGEPGDPLALESRLKSLIAAQPDVGALHFALGNIFARQARWSEAQQSFFKAFSAEPEHPDYIFNLAVSLDHLRQTRLAAQYYKQALDLAAQRPAGFDKAQLAARLREIQP